jgi:hypothetical protein
MSFIKNYSKNYCPANWDTENDYFDHRCESCVRHSQGLDKIGKCWYCYKENKDQTFGWYVEDGKLIEDKSYMDWNTYVKYREYKEYVDKNSYVLLDTYDYNSD